MNIATSDEVRGAYRQGEVAIIQLFVWLIQELQTQQYPLNKNSKKCSKSHSSDGFKKTYTLKKNGSRNSGGQNGLILSAVGIALPRGRTSVVSSRLFIMHLVGHPLFLPLVLLD